MSFIDDAETVAIALDKYYQQSILKEKPVINQAPLAQLVAEMDLQSWAQKGGLTGETLAGFIEKYLSTTTRLHHPGFLAHQCAAPHYSNALGSLIDGFTNNPMAIYEMGPGAASIEYFVINWMLEKIGWMPGPYPPNPPAANQIYGGGVLTHGGSLANLTALIAARSSAVPDIWENGNPGNLAMLTSPENHYSIARAAGILGIGQNSIYSLPVNRQGVIIPDKLPQTLERLKNDGKCAVALVANACSTAAGLFDPIKEIAHFCQENHLWFHVDGAHGASVVLSGRYKHFMEGIEQADSLSWDAHKMMQTSSLCTAVLVRDVHTLDQAFQQEASYLFHDKVEPGFDFIHRTVECTKAGLGLKFFMVLAALGEQGLTSFIERQIDLAAESYQFISQIPGFECPVKPQVNILCFRVPGSDEQQLAVRDKLISNGNFYLSTSDFAGKRYLRLSFMSPETTLDDIKALVSEIQQL
jgi:L-2,4-diaminobutyrate decarboxylase